MVESREPDYAPMSGCLYRLFWTLLGPGLLLVTGVAMIAVQAQPGSVLDFVYLGVLLALLSARLLDPEKTETAGRGKYAVGAFLAATALYLFAHFAAPRIM